jgi:hypothetical protein
MCSNRLFCKISTGFRRFPPFAQDALNTVSSHKSQFSRTVAVLHRSIILFSTLFVQCMNIAAHINPSPYSRQFHQFPASIRWCVNDRLHFFTWYIQYNSVTHSNDKSTSVCSGSISGEVSISGIPSPPQVHFGTHPRLHLPHFLSTS